jgi:hypothetical protein
MSASFRFDAHADAASAKAAFEAAHPLGSPMDEVLQSLARLGATCKSAGPGRVACRYVEKQTVLAGWCWHLALERDAAGGLRSVRVSLAALGM